jgi:Nuclease-related domain
MTASTPTARPLSWLTATHGAASAANTLDLRCQFADTSVMAISIGNPGYGALKRGALLIAVPVLLGTTLLAAIAGVVAWELGGSLLWAAALGCTLIAVELFWIRRTLADMALTVREGENWLRGARGERKVHGELMRLPDEYIVFNDFHPTDPRLGGRARWNLDHVVVGPTGVFVIDAKDYQSRFVHSASRDRHTRENARQVDRCARELKDEMRRWSGGALSDVFVVPVVAYAQEGVHVESLREKHVRVLPLRLLYREIVRHSERAIDMDKANRIARVFYDQMPLNDRIPFEDDLRRYGTLARTVGDRAEPNGQFEPTTANIPPAARRCPKCGSELETYTAKRGPNAGNTFLRCPGYPSCRHTEPLG